MILKWHPLNSTAVCVFIHPGLICEVSKLQQLASQLFRCRRSSKMALGLSFPLSGKWPRHMETCDRGKMFMPIVPSYVFVSSADSNFLVACERYTVTKMPATVPKSAWGFGKMPYSVPSSRILQLDFPSGLSILA